MKEILFALLIISEVADPADIWQARFVEIYNPGPDTVNFAEDTWYLSKQTNGASTWGDILLTGKVAPGECYVVAYSSTSFNTAFGFEPDQSSGSINGNGDDGYFLFHDGDHSSGTLVDAYGIIDQDGTGEPWEYLDTKATRKYDRLSQNASWDSLGWTIRTAAGTMAMSPSRHRDSLTWTGSTDDNWDDNGNWSDQGATAFIPDASNIIILPTDLLNYPALTNEAYCYNITLLANDSSNSSILGVDHLETIGAASVQCYMSGGTINKDDPNAVYHFCGSPLDSAIAIDVFPGSAYVREWDEITQEWINLTANDELIAGKAYSTWLPDSNAIITFTGVFNDTDISPLLTYTSGGTANPDYDGYNLVGNPFPSGLDWDMGSWGKINLDASIAIWDGSAGNYIYWNGTIGGISNGIIPPCQGFFVRANDLSPSLIIPLDACIHSNSTYYKNDQWGNEILTFSVGGGNNNYQDEIYIGFNTSGTIGFDNDFDALKLAGKENAPQLYSINEDDLKLAINILPYNHNAHVSLCFSNGYSGDFILLAEGMDSFGNQTELILKDLKLQSQVNLRQVSSYAFHYNENDDPGRFMLDISGMPSTIDGVREESVQINSDKRSIHIKHLENQSVISLYNVIGQLLYKQKIKSDQCIIPVQEASVYILHIGTSGNNFIHKILVQ